MINLEGQDRESTAKALAYQLHERTGIVKPPDPIVGGLLADYASLTAFDLTLEHALPIFDLAIAHRPVHADRIQQRRDHLARRVADRRARDYGFDWTLVPVGLFGLSAGLGVVLILRRVRAWRRRRVGAVV